MFVHPLSTIFPLQMLQEDVFPETLEDVVLTSVVNDFSKLRR
jgi:hypothetical protein